MPAADVYNLLYKKEDAHNDPIYTCSWTKTKISEEPNARYMDFIATGGLDGLVKVWTLKNNKLELVYTLEGHAMAVVSVAVSPDGCTLASSSLDSTLSIWDLVSGSKVHDIATGATDVWKIVFSADGTQIVTGSHSGKIVVYCVEKGSQSRVLDTRGKFTLSIDWSRNGKYICSGAVDGSLCIFDAVQGKLTHIVEAHLKAVRSVYFSPDSTLIVTASDDGFVKTFEVVSGALQYQLEHGAWAVSARFCEAGKRVVSAAVDGTVRVALTDRLRLLYTFKEHTDRVWGVNFNVEGDKICSVSQDKAVNIYECPLAPSWERH